MKTILITGCNGNLSLNIINFFKNNKQIRIIGCDIQDKFDPLKTLLDTNIIYYKVDLEQLEFVTEMICSLNKDKLIPDILINNAAVDSVPLIGVSNDGMELKNFNKIFNINVKAPIHLFKLLSEYWVTNKIHGLVINLSTIYSKVSPDPKIYPTNFIKNILYGSSKSALNSAFKQISVIYIPYNIRVNTLILAGVETDTQELEFKKKYLERIPSKRFLKIEEIFSAINFLMDERNSYMTGAELVIDGGYTLT